MAVKIRLARAGAKKAPFYRVVVADARAPRDGRFIEILGRYNPRTQPSLIELDLEKIDAWIAKGAEPSETVAKLIAIAKNPTPVAPEKGPALSKKAQAKADAEAKAAADAEASAAKAAEEAAAAQADEAEPESTEVPAEGDREVIDEDLGEPAEDSGEEAAE